MIFWTIFWLVSLAVLGYGLWAYNIRDAHLPTYSRAGDGFIAVGILFVLFCFIASIVVTGIAQDAAVTARSDKVLIAERTRIRDELAETVRDELSAEQYEALLSALPDDTDLVWLGDGAGRVIVERAGRIIELNEAIYRLELGIVSKRKDVCDIIANPINPQFPFGLGLPDCELDIEED